MILEEIFRTNALYHNISHNLRAAKLQTNSHNRSSQRLQSFLFNVDQISAFFLTRHAVRQCSLRTDHVSTQRSEKHTGA